MLRALHRSVRATRSRPPEDSGALKIPALPEQLPDGGHDERACWPQKPGHSCAISGHPWHSALLLTSRPSAVDLDFLGKNILKGLNHYRPRAVQLTVMCKLASAMPKRKNSERDFECEHCGKAFTKSSRLQEHIRTVHEGRRDFECEQCGKAVTPQ